MSEQPADPARTTSAGTTSAGTTSAGTTSAGTPANGDVRAGTSPGDGPAQPPHEGDHRDPASASSESERELAETVRSISRLEESN